MRSRALALAFVLAGIGTGCTNAPPLLPHELPEQGDSGGLEPRCGNGRLEEGEACDGDPFGSATRAGFGGGALHCGSDCRIQTSAAMAVPPRATSRETSAKRRSCWPGRRRPAPGSGTAIPRASTPTMRRRAPVPPSSRMRWPPSSPRRPERTTPPFARISTPSSSRGAGAAARTRRSSDASTRCGSARRRRSSSRPWRATRSTCSWQARRISRAGGRPTQGRSVSRWGGGAAPTGSGREPNRATTGMHAPATAAIRSVAGRAPTAPTPSTSMRLEAPPTGAPFRTATFSSAGRRRRRGSGLRALRGSPPTRPASAIVLRRGAMASPASSRLRRRSRATGAAPRVRSSRESLVARSAAQPRSRRASLRSASSGCTCRHGSPNRSCGELPGRRRRDVRHLDEHEPHARWCMSHPPAGHRALRLFDAAGNLLAETTTWTSRRAARESRGRHPRRPPASSRSRWRARRGTRSARTTGSA